ncbi:cobalamin B12-binding domain-containing protein [bacterium]|nr:cobalamin B12-binding domain-containing protein [bacterium]
MNNKKVLIAKPGLDGHDRGAKVISRALRDAGYNVIYTGIRQTPEQIVAVALDEDVNFIGLSCLSGAHVKLFSHVLKLLNEQDAENISVIGGGVIPDRDIAKLKELGIKEIFTPGTPLKTVISWFKENS